MDTNTVSTEKDAVSLTPAEEPIRICGFWRRFFAFLIDSTILGIVGIALGSILFDILAGLGGWGRLLGFSIALPYFVILNSSIGKGQTIGKKALKIEVIMRDGSYIAPARSIARYSILAVPYFLNGAMIPPEVISSPIGYLLSFIVFGMGISIVYLLIFNRSTRQSIHDLSVQTFVTHKSNKGDFNPSPVWKFHYIVVGILLVASVGVMLAIPTIAKKGILPDLLALQKNIISKSNVHMATAIVGTTKSNINGNLKESTYFHSNVILKERPADYEEIANRIAAIVIEEYPAIDQKDSLGLTLSYGYDIGIANAWSHKNFWHSPNEWREILTK